MSWPWVVLLLGLVWPLIGVVAFGLWLNHVQITLWWDEPAPNADTRIMRRDSSND